MNDDSYKDWERPTISEHTDVLHNLEPMGDSSHIVEHILQLNHYHVNCTKSKHPLDQTVQPLLLFSS
jgi:hypothetical protein